MHVGQSVVSPLDAEREALVVDTEQVEHGGVDVVDLDRVVPNIVGEK
jgi:hypothetical protein